MDTSYSRVYCVVLCNHSYHSCCAGRTENSYSGSQKNGGRAAGDVAGGSANDFINLKLSAAGVMPIIFAQAIMFLPLTAAQWATSSAGTQSDLLLALNDPMSLAYNAVFLY